MGHGGRWKAYYTHAAITFIKENVTSKRIACKLFEYRELLECFPDLGNSYEPTYPAARPPFPCRVAAVPDTPFSIYYLKDEDAKQAVIFAIEFQRTDPNVRFASSDW